MSMNNTPKVILGKIYNQDDIDDLLFEELLEEEHSPLMCQAGESNWDSPCIGFILGSMDRYDENQDIVIFDTPEDMMLKVNDLLDQIRTIGLSVERHEIKLYLRDDWG